MADLIAKIGADVTDFDRKMKGVTESMAKAGAKMQSIGKSMSIGLTAPIALFGATILKASGDFEAGMNNVQALTGATGDGLADLTNLAKELGSTTQFSASEAADGMGFLAQAGFSTEKVLGSMSDTLNLAAAAQLDLGSSADIVSNIMAGFSIPVDDLGGAVDILTKAFTSSNTDLTQLGQAMKFVGPVAKNMGISMADTASAVGALSDAGIQAGMAGRGLRTLLAQIQTKADDLGVSLKDTNGEMKSLPDLMDELSKAGISGQNALAIFGNEAGPVLQVLLGKGSDALRKQTKLLESSGGTADRIAKTKMKGFNGAMKAMASAFEGVQIAIADSGILNFFTGFVNGLANTLREIAKTSPSMLKMGVVIAGVVAVAGPLIFVLGAVTSAVAAISAPVLLLVGGLAALAIGIGAASVAGDGITEQFERQKSKVENLDSTLVPLLAKHDKLKSKTVLTKDEQIQLDKVIQDISRHVPSATTAFDKFGNALSVNTDIAKAYIKEQKDILEFDNAESIKEQEDALIQLGNKEKWITGLLDLHTRRIKKKLEVDEDQIRKHKAIAAGVQKEITIRTNKIATLKGELTANEKLLKSEQERAEASAKLAEEEAGLAEEIEDVTVATKDLNEELSKVVDPFKGFGEGGISSPSADDSVMGDDPFAGMGDTSGGMSEATTELMLYEMELAKAAEAQAKLAEKAKIMGDTVGGVFEAFGTRVVDSFGEAETGLGRFVSAMGQTAVQLLAQLLSQSIAAAITAGSLSALSAGPAAAFALPAFQAMAIGGVLSAFAAIPAFALGTDFAPGGPALVGEKGPEIVNLPRGSQVVPNNKIGGMGGGGVSGHVTFEIAGTSLRGVLNAADRRSGYTSSGTNFNG